MVPQGCLLLAFVLQPDFGFSILPVQPAARVAPAVVEAQAVHPDPLKLWSRLEISNAILISAVPA